MATRVRDEARAADYDADLAAWCAEQGRWLREGRLDRLDLANIAEEIESLGGEQENALESHLARVIEHLLKLDHSADAEPRRGWRLSVREQRAQARKRLRRNPSLRAKLGTLADEAWEIGLVRAQRGVREDEAVAMALAGARYTVEQLLDEAYFGEREAAA